MRTFGWAVAVIVGGYTAFVVVRSIPDIVRYAKLSTM